MNGGGLQHDARQVRRDGGVHLGREPASGRPVDRAEHRGDLGYTDRELVRRRS